MNHRLLRALGVVGLLGLVWIFASGFIRQTVGLIGTTIPNRLVPPPVTGVLNKSDFQFLGYVRFAENTASPQDCNLDANTPDAGVIFAAKTVNGTVHFFVNEGTGVYAATGKSYVWDPCEFTDPSTYDLNGNCTANCPTTDVSLAPSAALLTNWGINPDGTQHQVFGAKMGQYWDGTGTLISGDQCCFVYGFGVPTNGPANAIYITYGKNYGTPTKSGGLLLATLDAANDGTGKRATSLYGPFTVQSPPGVGNIPGGTQQRGFWNAGYLLSTPDGYFAHGFSWQGATQAGENPTGPTLMATTTCTGCVNGWPGPTTPVGPTANVPSDRNYLHFYNMDGFVDRTNCHPNNGATIWAYQYPEAYPYVTELARDAVTLVPKCNQGAAESIDPTSTGGVGTWGESSFGTAMVWITTATGKRGVVAFTGTSTNHTAGNVTSCTNAHVWYCSGEDLNMTTNNACADGPAGPGTFASPQYNCPFIQPGMNGPGPVTNFQEARWIIFDPNDLNSVMNGNKTDYTVSTQVTIFPESEWNIPAHMERNKAPMGAYYNSATGILYVAFSEDDNFTTDANQVRPAIAVFHIVQ